MGEHKRNPLAAAAKNGLLGGRQSMQQMSAQGRPTININLDQCAGFHCPNCLHDRFIQEYVLREGSALILGKEQLIQVHTQFICKNCGWSGKAANMTKLTPQEAAEMETRISEYCTVVNPEVNQDEDANCSQSDNNESPDDISTSIRTDIDQK